jgi:L-lactate dehydrogenase complex protein LldG
MTGRQQILGRIREALAVEAPFPGRHDVSGKPAPSSFRARDYLPFVGDSVDEQLAAFRQNAANLQADFQLPGDRDEFKKQLIGLRDAGGWKKIATHSGELTDFALQSIDIPAIKTDSGYDTEELEKCDAGITECDALIAQTGSVLVTNRSAGGRALSVLPPHHVVLARRGQLLRDLPAAFELLRQKYGANYPSMISFITGPSRTGDIERILVLGAHGPRRLTIFLL